MGISGIDCDLMFLFCSHQVNQIFGRVSSSGAPFAPPACEAPRAPDVSNDLDDDTDSPPAMRASFNCNASRFRSAPTTGCEASHARLANRPWFDRVSLC